MKGSWSSPVPSSTGSADSRVSPPTPSATSPRCSSPSSWTTGRGREVEDDPGYKQIIPYVVFRSGDEVFCYTRGQVAGRGAAAPAAVAGRRRARRPRRTREGGRTLDAYETALRRELDEEVAVASPGGSAASG